MAISSDFLVFATGAGANVLDQPDYAAAPWLQTGFSAGIAVSEYLNKVWRQSSFVAAGVAQFILNELAISVPDDGNLGNFVANLSSAIRTAASAGVASVNGRVGNVTIIGSDITTALGGTPLLLAGGTMTGKLNLVASGTGGAGLNIGGGSAPPSPINFDFWGTSSGVFAQIAGSTVQLANPAGGSVTSFMGRSGAITLLLADLTTTLGGTPYLQVAESTVASAATTNLGAVGSNIIAITGTVAITSFGSSASTSAPVYTVRFSGSLTLTNSTSLILPGAANIKTQAGDCGFFKYEGSGNWRCISYTPANGTPVTMTGAEASLASAATCDLGTTGVSMVNVTGTTNISSFGSTATTADPVYVVRFSGALTLTFNATSMILPGGVNLTVAAGDAAVMEYLGSSNWRMLIYQSSSGKLLAAAIASTATAKAGVDTTQAIDAADLAAVIQTGCMVTGHDTSGTANVIVVALTPSSSGLTDGMYAFVRAANNNTAATTLNLDGHGAKAVTKGGAALAGGETTAGEWYLFIYDLATTSWQLQGGTTSGSVGVVGWIKFGNGQIQQWGTSASCGNTLQVGVTFPIVFPNAAGPLVLGETLTPATSSSVPTELRAAYDAKGTNGATLSALRTGGSGTDFINIDYFVTGN